MTMAASPGFKPASGASDGLSSRSLIQCFATCRFSPMKDLAETVGLTRLVSKIVAQGFFLPRMASDRITAAAVPLVMPHALKPVAVETCFEAGVSLPI